MRSEGMLLEEKVSRDIQTLCKISAFKNHFKTYTFPISYSYRQVSK